MYILYSNGHLPEPTGKNIPVICKINQEMSLLIPRPVIRNLRTCFDSWPGIRQRAKPLLRQMSSEERWVGQISMSRTLKWKLKIEDLARNSSTSVSTPLTVIYPRKLLWCGISLLQVSKGNTVILDFSASRFLTALATHYFIAVKEWVSYFRVESSGTLGFSDIFGSADQPANEATNFRVVRSLRVEWEGESSLFTNEFVLFCVNKLRNIFLFCYLLTIFL